MHASNHLDEDSAALRSAGSEVAFILHPTCPSHPYSSPSASDGDVLRDAEAYLCEYAESGKPEVAVLVAAPPLVSLGDPKQDGGSVLRDVLAASWSEEEVGAAALTQMERRGSVRLASSGDALRHHEAGSEKRPLAVSAAMGPVAPYTVANDVLCDGLDGGAICSVPTTRAATPLLPYLVAAAEEDEVNRGPANWMAYGGAAARAAASRAAGGAAEMAAAQVPGGSLAVSAARKGATIVSESRAAVSSVSVSSLASPVAAPVASSLRTSSTHARTAATAAATQRRQQLQVYVTQNFVPTLSDFVPGANAVAERAALKTRAWATARVETRGNTRGGTAAVAVVDEVRVGTPSPSRPTMLVTADGEDVTRGEACCVIRTEAASPIGAGRGEEGQCTGSPHGPRNPDASPPLPPPSSLREQQQSPAGEAELMDASAQSAKATIIPYAALRVFLCRSDGGARSGNNAVEAVAKFGRMPCKRKLQELTSNFAYNLLPRTPDIGKGRSPYRELLVMQAQHQWSGTASAEVDPTSAPFEFVPAGKGEEEESDGEGSRCALPAAAKTTISSPADTPEHLRSDEGERTVKRRCLASFETETTAAAANIDRPSGTVLNPLVGCAPLRRSGTEPAYASYMSYGHHTVLYNARYGMPELLPWTRECPFCCSAATCREGCCCLHCQLARQCNMLNYQRPTVLWPLCCLTSVLDPCTCFMCSSALACVNRATARARYGIDGCFLGDCLCALFCTRCMTAQVMDEMMAHGEYPGGICMLPPMAEPVTTTMQ